MYYFPMATYIRRLIGNALLQLNDRPVLILEGARAVGKTTMVRRQLEQEAGYHYTSLEDSSTLERTRADPQAWVRSLPLPAIIDEAQLNKDLPLVIKTYVDSLEPGNHFVLTGSASIGRTGLGGTDPLARRVRRLTMHPISQWEIAGHNGSLVDALFDWSPQAGRYQQQDDVQLVDRLRIGGFPSYLFSPAAFTRRRLSSSLASDITAILSDSVAPDLDFNITKSRTVLDALLRTPGGILNATALASQVGIDKRTVERYVDLFGRLFLLQWLPNLAIVARKQDFSRAKIHPVDSSFAVDALDRAGLALLEKREFFGQVLESVVVSELMAHAQWSEIWTQAFYWRQTGSQTHEVDLVLIDESEREVAIEVKAASSVASSDLRGIRAFSSNRSLHRGYIFYRGNELLQLDNNIWALPMSVLGDASAFNPPPMESAPNDTPQLIVRPPNQDQDADARIFLSYVHADDTALKGRITQFARDLVDTYALLFGHTIQLFVDREDITWGQQWAERLNSELGAATFLLAAVTPRYLSSEACRNEVLVFSAAVSQAGEPARLLLPLQWVDISKTDIVPEVDPIRQRLMASQYEDVTELRRIDPETITYQQVVERVANRLKDTIDQRTTSDTRTISESPDDDGPDVLELIARIEAVQDNIESATTEVRVALNGLAQALADEPRPARFNTDQAAAFFRRLRQRFERPRAQLEQGTAALSSAWTELDENATALVALQWPSEARSELAESLKGLVRALEIPGIDELQAQIRYMNSISRQFRPAGRAIEATMQLLRGIQASAQQWLRTIESSG